MERPVTQPGRPCIWAIGEVAQDRALLRRLELAGVQPTAGREGCQVGLLDFRNANAAASARLIELRAAADTRDLLFMAIVDDASPAFRAAIDAGADGIVADTRLEIEALDRVRLLLRRQRERDASVRHERDLAALLDLTSDYARTRDVSALFHKVTRRLADELQIRRCALVLFDEDRAQGRIVATSDDSAPAERTVELAQYPELREVAKSGQPLVLDDAPTHPLLDEVRDRLVGQAIGAIAAVPLAVHARVYGALLLRAGEARRTFSPREMAFVTTVAHATAVALRNANLIARAEAQVASLSRYEGFFNAFFHGIAVLGPNGELLSLNPAGLRLLELTPPVRVDLIARALTPSAMEALMELVYRARRNESRTELDVPIVLASGRPMTVALSAALLGGEAGPGLEGAVIVCFRDVTSARATQSELRKTNDFLERLIDQASDAIIAADMHGKVMLFNRGAERICGYGAADAIGKLDVRNLYPPGMARDLMKKIRSPQFGGSGRLEALRAVIVSKSGEQVPVSMTAALITEDLGGVQREVATLGIFSDLRDRVKLEQTLTQTQEQLEASKRAAVVAELAGTAAHELNQPLTSIMGYAELLRRRLRDEDPAVRSVDIIYREAERMAEIVRKIGKITKYETKAYVGNARIVDLDRAAGGEEDA